MTTTDELKMQGERVRLAREARGWSQADLASEAGVSPNTVLSIELGKKKPWAKNLRAVLDTLDLASFADDEVLDLSNVPADVRSFLKVVANRVSPMSEDRRARLFSALYPQIIESDETADLIAQARRERLAERDAEGAAARADETHSPKRA